MRKRNLLLGAASIFVMATSVLVFGADNLNVVIDDIPPGSDCICPHVWAPVICTIQNPDGSTTKRYYSNACVAACNGATNCARIVFQQ